MTITSIISNNTTYDLGILSSIRRLHKTGNWSPYAKVGRYILTREAATALSQSVVSCLRFSSFSAYGVGVVRERLQFIAQIIHGVRCVSHPICLAALLNVTRTSVYVGVVLLNFRMSTATNSQDSHASHEGGWVWCYVIVLLQASAALSWCMSVYAGDY